MDYYNLGLDEGSLFGFDQTSSTAGSGTSGDSWLMDAWGSVKGVLNDGISIWQDVEALKNPPVYSPTVTTVTPDYQPVDQTQIANAQVAAQTWVPGVRNEFVVLGGLGLMLAGLYLANR